MQPAFHRAVLDRFVTQLDVGINRLTSTWEAQPNGTVVDVDSAMMRTALEVVGRALFSHDLSGDAARLVHAVLEALDVVVARARSPLPLPVDWPTPGNRRLSRSLQTLDDTVVAMLRERRRVDRQIADDDQAPADLLGMLLAARDDIGGTGFDDRQLRDEIVTLIVAGHETVASALTWTWHLLAQNPDAEKRLHTELDEVLAGRHPTFADLERLPYTRQVIDEALRLYPPAWVISRRAVVDSELAGYSVPAGSYVFVSPYVLHRTPELWPEPNRFEPERFGPGFSIDRFAYIPFGAGPNLCIGRDFALLEATLLVAAVAARFRLTSIPGADVQVDPLVTIRPRGGLPMVLSRREG
jgi:cytochrome P450